MMANDSWKLLLKQLVEFGNRASPRNMPCRELLGQASSIDMTYPVITIKERDMGYKFLCAEAVWILTGDNRLRTIKKYAPKISDFCDLGYVFQGAYGPKVTEQIFYVVDTIRKDSDTRQAVINIWREMPRESRDIPCTLSLQFLVRTRQFSGVRELNCVATMRSSDTWLGWVYDVFNFSMISAYICLILQDWIRDLRLGRLILTAGSQHLYDYNIDQAKTCYDSENYWNYKLLDISTFSIPDDLVNHLVALRDQNWSGLKSAFLSELQHRVK